MGVFLAESLIRTKTENQYAVCPQNSSWNTLSTLMTNQPIKTSEAVTTLATKK